MRDRLTRARASLAALGIAVALSLATAEPLDAASRAMPCASTEVTASIAPAASEASKAAPPDRLSIVLVGDTGFNPNAAEVDPAGVRKGREVTRFRDTLAATAPDIDGDLAFVNLETVVTDRNDIPTDGNRSKGSFHFRSHPAAAKALMDAGFNLFSLANNHSMDYGALGVEETLYHMAVAAAERAIAYAGIGSTFEEATRPGCLELDGVRVGFGAIGIITGDLPQHRAGPRKPGQASYRDRQDYEQVVDRLAALDADYRILSIHYGLEGRVVPDDRQLADWRGVAAETKGIDLIVGHHAHVAQGVELNGKSLIFYGLGNFMHPGTAEMTRFGVCRDYGLMAKVHLAREAAGWKVGAVEAIPLTKTNERPERFAAAEGQTRIYALNHLAGELDDGKSAKGVRFTPRADGSGLYCAPGAAGHGGKLAALCQGWQEAAAPPKPLADKIALACEDKPFYGKPALTKRRAARRPAPAARRAAPGPSGTFRPF
jgi:poly-gamma-glutamate synthesis protein (capsule biosynthesis protein)